MKISYDKCTVHYLPLCREKFYYKLLSLSKEMWDPANILFKWNPTHLIGWVECTGTVTLRTPCFSSGGDGECGHALCQLCCEGGSESATRHSRGSRPRTFYGNCQVGIVPITPHCCPGMVRYRDNKSELDLICWILLEECKCSWKATLLTGVFCGCLQCCGSGKIYSGSSFEFSEFRIRIQAKVADLDPTHII